MGNLVNLKNWQDVTALFGEFEISQKQLDDLVANGNGYATVLNITQAEVELLAYGCDLDYYNYEEILPIPLTEEWLVKTGFKSGCCDWYTIRHEDIFLSVCLQPNRKCMIFNGVSSDSLFIPCPEFVHTLQNCFYALTGKELL